MSKRILVVTLMIGLLLKCGLPAQAYNSDLEKIFSGGIGTRSVSVATNNILTVSIETTTGQFTITTGSSHPKPGQTVFYPIGTSDISLRDATGSIMFSNGSAGSAGLTGYSLQSMRATAPVTTALGTTGFRTTYTVPNYRIVQDVVINGTTLANTNVKHQVSVTNTSNAARTFGVRYQWDWQIAGNDASLFRTRTPDGAFTSTFATFNAPAFKLYEEVDNATTPAFSIFGSVRDLPLSPAPTLPDQVRYCSWSAARSTAWDFTNTGSGSDSSVCYYWGFNTPRSLAAGATAVFAQYVTTQLEAISPAVTITKSAASTVSSGSNLTYTITYGNTGTAEATGVVIQDTVPTGTTFVSATGGGTHANGVVTWSVGSIPANTTGRTVTFTVRVTATSGSITNSTYSIKGTNTGTAYGPAVTTTVSSVPAGVAPTLTINPPGPVTFSPCTPITFLVTGTDPDAGAQLTLSTSTALPAGATMTPALPRTGATGVNSRFNWTPNAAQVNNYTLTFTVRDETGLTNTKSFLITKDITVPTIAITTPPFKACVNALPSIAGTISDTGSGAKAPLLLIQRLSNGQYWNGSAWGALPVTLTTVLSGANWSRTSGLPASTNLLDGDYHVAAIASDNVGNTTGALTYFTVDKTIPSSVTFIVPAASSTVNSLPFVYGAASDNAGGCGIARVVFSLIRASDGKYWSGATATGWVTTSTLLRATIWPVSGGATVNWSAPASGYVMPTGTNLPNGSYTLRATAYDAAGNSKLASIAVTVNNTVITPYSTATK